MKLSSILDLLPELDQATITAGVSKLLLVKWDFSDVYFFFLLNPQTGISVPFIIMYVVEQQATQNALSLL